MLNGMLKIFINTCRVVITLAGIVSLVISCWFSTLGADYARAAIHDLPYLVILVGLAIGVWFLPIE